MSWFVRIAIFFIHLYVHKIIFVILYTLNVVVRENSYIFQFYVHNLNFIFGVSHLLIDTFFLFLLFHSGGVKFFITYLSSCFS